MASLSLNSHIFRLPTELLLEVSRLLTRSGRRHFALAYPQIPQLMIPVLNDLYLSNHPSYLDEYHDSATDPTLVLALLHSHPRFADQIRHVTYYVDTFDEFKHDPQGHLPVAKPESLIHGWTRRPRLPASNPVQELHVMKNLAKRVGTETLASLEQNMRYWATTFENKLDLARLSIILALATHIRSINIVVPDEDYPEGDLLHFGLLGLATALLAFRSRGQTLDCFNLSTYHAEGVDPNEDDFIPCPNRAFSGKPHEQRNLATLLSIILAVHTKHLRIAGFRESLLHRGEWSLYTGVSVDEISIHHCYLCGGTFTRLLYAVNGLRTLDVRYTALEVARTASDLRGYFDRYAQLWCQLKQDIEVAIEFHKHTLTRLRIEHLQDASSFHNLKVLVAMFCEERSMVDGNVVTSEPVLCNLLPQSIHTIVSNWWDGSRGISLFSMFAKHIEQAPDSFPYLRHVFQERTNLDHSIEEVTEGLEIIGELAGVGIEAACHSTALTGSAFRRQCIGECGMKRSRKRLAVGPYYVNPEHQDVAGSV